MKKRADGSIEEEGRTGQRREKKKRKEGEGGRQGGEQGGTDEKEGESDLTRRTKG